MRQFYNEIKDFFFCKKQAKIINYCVRSIKCNPESVSMMSDNSPTFKAKAASSKGFCMEPLPNGPKSPPRLAELQSEYFCAS